MPFFLITRLNCCYVMLCYAMLCYVMLCYVMSCYVMLCYVMLCYVMLCYVVLLFTEDCWEYHGRQRRITSFLRPGFKIFVDRSQREWLNGQEEEIPVLWSLCTWRMKGKAVMEGGMEGRHRRGRLQGNWMRNLRKRNGEGGADLSRMAKD